MMRNLFITIIVFIFTLLFIAGCVTVEKTTYTEKEILDTSLPVSTPAEYVALYEDYRTPVPEDPRGIDEARKICTSKRS